MDMRDEPASGTAVEFGPFTFSPTRRELRRDGALIPLSARVLRLLSLLLERSGQVVGRTELAAQLWPAGGVEESSLRAHIAGLRRALGQDRYIVNVLGRGYSFVGDCRQRAVLPALPGAAPLVGRDEAVTLLCALLRRRRLVSIVGAVGIGKSVVARAVAAGLALEFSAGACVVDLADVKEDGDLPAAIAAAGAAAGTRLLLVLDNCEHLVDAVAALAETLLSASDGPTLLVTSREALSLPDEWVHRLAPLELADVAAPRGERSPAARLFGARASSLHPTPQQWDSIETLCRQLDGNPLAIELAAQHAEAYGFERLDAGFDWLFPAADTHHRSFGAALDAGIALLAPHERTVLLRLGVFPDGFSLESASAVCACTTIAPALVVETILVLAARSLVDVEGARATPCYRLSNLTRRYALRQLARGTELPALQRSHARGVLVHCLRAEDELPRMPAAEWRLRHHGLAGEFGAAMEWAFSPAGDDRVGIDLAAGACFVLVEIGCGDAHRRWIVRALQALAESGHEPAIDMRLLTGLAMLDAHLLEGDGDDGAARARSRLLALTEQCIAGESTIAALQALAGWGLGHGDYRLVLEMAERIAAFAARAAEPGAAVLANRLQAQALHFLGSHDAALPLARSARAHATLRRGAYYQSKVPVPVSMGVLTARTQWIQGLPDQAQRTADAAVAQADGHHPHALCMALGLGAIPVALWRGDIGHAAQLAARFAELVECAGSRFWGPWRISFQQVLEGRLAPGVSNQVLRDMLATFDPMLADAGCLRRVRTHAVGWNAPEVLRAAGVQRLQAGARDEAAALFLEARACARDQRATGWELRAAISLVRLRRGTEFETQSRLELAQLLAQFGEGAATADLAQARALPASPPSRQHAPASWCASLLDPR